MNNPLYVSESSPVGILIKNMYTYDIFDVAKQRAIFF